MKRKSTFLRLFALLALMLPWSLQAQNAKVSEYDGSATTATYASIVSTGTAQTFSGDYVDVQMPFAMNFGETNVPANSTLRIWKNGSVTFNGIAALADAQIAPLYLAAGYTTTQVYTRSTAQVLTVEWRKVVSGTNSYCFQLKLYPNGDIEFCYGPMTINSSINVLVGMMSSATDIYRVGGADGGSDWSDITRYTTGTATRTLSSTYAPAYNLATSEGMVYTFTQPACVKPSTATATALAWNSIKVDWTVSSPGNSFEIKYSTDPDFDPNTEGTSKTVSDGTATTYTITGSGLQGSTTYYIYVRKVCSGTPSGWSPMATATTLPGCFNANMPSVTPDGVVTWTSPDEMVTSYDVKYGPAGFDPATAGTAVNNITALTYTIPNLGSNTSYDVYLRTHCSASGLTTDWVGPVTFVSPCVGGCTYMAILTDTYGDSWNDNHLDYYANGVLMASYTNTDDYGAYEDDTVYISVCSGDQIQFVYMADGMYASENNMTIFNHQNDAIVEGYNGGSGSAILYSGVGCQGITCRKPSDLTNVSHTGNSVTLSWTENGTATAWQIAYGLFTNDDDYTIVDATTNPFTVSGLGLGEWQFYVRSNCAADDKSDWVGPVSQTFGYCSPNPTSVDNNGITNVTFGNDIVVNDNISKSNGLYQNRSTMVGDLFAGANAEVSIKYATGYTYGTIIWVDWNDDMDFEDEGEVVYRGQSLNNNPTTLIASFNIPVTAPLGDHRMRIAGADSYFDSYVSNTSSYPNPCYSATYSMALDYTVRVVAAPSCFKPNSLAVSGVTATEATLTWVEAGLSTQWEVKLGAHGFNPDEEGTSFIVNGTPTLALSYLYMVTDYDAYVRAICNPEGPTEWSTVCSFRTFCPNGGSATMGTGTTATSGVIVNSAWGNTYCQQIFTADELVAAGLQAGDIAGMTFTWNGDGSYQKDFSIYMGNTNQENFSSTTAWVPIASQTLVYGPTLRPTSGTSGEQEYLFTTPFTWDGTSNIVISTFINQHGGSQSSSGFNSYSTNSGKTNVSMWKYRDSQAFTESEVDALTASSRSGYRASIKLIRPCDTGSCNAPATVIALSETEYAATLTFTDVNGEANPTYGIIWGPQGFNPASAGTTVSPIATTTYTLSNLAAQTSYDVYVYAICSGTNGRMVKYNFVTPFIPNCKTPILAEAGYGASNITYNTATLTWRQPGDVPQTWTIRYAAADFNPATAAATDYTELTVQGSTTPSAQLTGLVAGTTYYVYVKATCATAPQLDESPWSLTSNATPAYTFTTPTCVVPANVAASDVTNSTAVISWTESGDATAWTLKYGPAGFDPDLEGTEVACTAATKEITGLDAYTSYEVYVKSNCTATDESGWSNAATFKTSCPDGGDVEVVGITAGTQYTIPVNTYYNYSYTQQLITADEIPGATTIQGISLKYNYSSALDPTKYDVTIYIGTTDKASFTSSVDFVDPATLTAVWHGTFNVEQGWNNFVFDTPFEYDGSGNIVVAFHDNVTGYNTSSHSFNTMTTDLPMALAYYSDSYNPDASSATSLAAYSGTKTTYSYRNVMKLMATCNTDVTCFAPASVSTSITPANVVTVNWTARTDLRPVVNNFELKYGLAGFNPDNQGAGTLVSNLNNVFNYNITASLESDEDYDVYVRTVCGENSYSKWTKTSFHTYPTCWAPSALTVTGTTSSSATLSWVENTPTAATRWEVVYGLEGFNPDRATPLETTSNTGFVINGLNHSTRYEFYVRAVCSTTDHSDWSPVATGTTQCGIWQYADMPLVENFDGVTGTTSSTINNHVLPNCWDYINTSTTTSGTSTTGYPGYPIAYNSASYSHSGNNHMRFYTYTTAAYGDQYAILPQFGFNLDTVVVGFYARESSTTATYVGTIEVGVMTDPDDVSTFVTVGTVLPTTTSYEYFEVDMSDYNGNGRYIALKAPKPTTGYNVAYVDDLTVKLREKVNTLAAGATIAACNEFMMPDTTNGGSYPNNLNNATYVIRPAEAGKVAHITGDYDLEYGFDFLNVYRGAVNANNLIGRYTGNGTIDYKTNSNLWADSGYVTLVLTTDADNAFPMVGFKLLVQCEDPEPADDIDETFEENGTFTWRNGETYTNAVVRTGLTYDANEQPTPDMDRSFTATHTYVNVAGVDSVTYNMALTLHPSYNLTYNATICDRDVFTFYGTDYTTTNTYTVPMQSQYGADSTGILVLQVNPAPSAAIYKNGDEVTEINGHCDKADLTLLARSNENSATFVWEDNSSAATRVVNPHVSNTYTVVATNPTTGCTSLPATVTVTTTPVPALTINGDAEICYGQSATLTVTDANNVEATYRWNTGATGTSITVNPTTTTTYTVTATTSNTSACTATAEFNVTVNQLPVVAATASVSEICRDSVVTLTATNVEGYSYSWNTGATTAVATTAATSTGAYTVTVTDQKGCVNEFTTASVTVHPSYEMSDSLKVCYTYNPYTWGDITLTANGNYDQNFTIAHGCDSLVHLNFTFEEMGVENSNVVRCYGDSYTFENITRTATADTNLFYIDNSGECPVRYNLAVTVNPVKATTVPQTVCDTYTWPVSGETYTVSGEYPYTLATTKNCDSVVTLNLTVNYQNTGVETVTACDNYVWDLNGVNYTVSTNEPTFTLQNQWGCDSVVTLNLTVNNRSYHEEFHCVSDARSYTWSNGRTYNLNVDVADSIQFVTGENAVGCNEIALLHLIMNPVLDTLAWVDVEACDEYVINNEVTVNQQDCHGVVAPLYLRESGDYEIRTRAADGHDQWTRIHLTITPSTYHTTVATGCLPYTWSIYKPDSTLFEVATITEEMVNGASPFNMSVDLAEAGFVTSSCSSIEVLRLTPKYPSTEVTEEATICSNGSWIAPNSIVFSGADYATGTYTWDNTALNADGCPLTKQVNLTVNPAYLTATAELTFCESDFVFNETTGNYELTVADNVEGHSNPDVVLTIPGDLNDVAYTNTVDAIWQTAQGCDSLVSITYTVIPTMHVNDVVADACHDYTWSITGEKYTESNIYTESLVDDVTGCKVIYTLDLTVLGTSEGTETREVCTSYIGPDNVTYYTDHTFDIPYEGTLEIVNGCDSITHVTYNVRQSALFENNVVTNQPYTWANGETYTQNVSNVYYQLPDTDGDGCYDVLVLNLTMVDPIVLCDNQLPYTWTLGETSFTIAGGATSGVWNNGNADGNDTIIAYTINNTDATPVAETACDSYTWSTGNGETYTTSGEYVYTTTNAAGCDSVVTLTLTINASTTATVAETACDSYTWSTGNGETYTASGAYVWNTTNGDNCPHAVTLNLTINKNNGVEVAESACDSYTWDRTNLTYNASGDYSASFADANGCVGDSILHLTIYPTYNTNSDTIINNAGSFTYLNVMYTAPVDTIITHTFQSVNGCDSIDHLHIIIPVANDIVEVNVEACGTYTWTVADGGTGHTYGWIPMTERQSHGMALYKDLTDNKYVYTYPTDTTFVGGVMTQVRVLHLNLLESTSSAETVNVPVSLGHYDIMNVVDNSLVETVNFTYADRGTTMVMDHPVGVGSVAYCDDYRTFTFNIIDNYDTTTVYACADETSYEWNSVSYTIGEPGHTYYFAQKENEGTMNELVHVLKINQRVANAETITETVCDSYTWTAGNGETYTNSVSGVVYNYTDANGCAATKTLNLTVKHNTSFAYTADVCDTYTWTRNNQVYTTTGNYIYSYTDSNNCQAADTLHLTIRNNTNTTITKAECESYTWTAEDGGDGRVLTTSGTETYNYTAVNGCPSVNTLNLTINNNTDTVITKDMCDTYTWTAEDGGNGQVYTTSGVYTYDYNTAAGCPSTNTLNLTIRTSTSSIETLAQCDNYIWTDGSGINYTESGVYTYTGTNVAGCDSLMTLNLTINVNTTGVEVTETACDEYTWTINNRLYTTSGNYTANTTDVNGCGTTNTLHLTINHSSSYDSILFISDGSYRYYGQTATELFGEGVYNRTENYTNVAGCDSTLNITFNVGTALLGIDNVVNCNDYTWRNGETYVWISDAERAANLNDENVAPLYKTSTGTYIYYNPTFTVVRENAFDSIYMLALTLTQSYQGYFEATVNVSEGAYNYVDATRGIDTVLSFADAAAEQQNFVNEDREYNVEFDAPEYCNGIMTVTLHLVNNYQLVDADDICVTTSSYTWRGHEISTATNDYDHAHTYYVYDTLATGNIEYRVVNQHPLAYATERRTACDEYTWNGTTYTESTSNATAFFPEGTIINGQPLVCDSTVTLILTINHNTSTTTEISACETYTWLAANGGNGETYTTSGTYTRDYLTAQGCPSTNTLVLTVNTNTNTEYTVDACDTYTWSAEEGGNGTVYTTSSPAEGYTFNYNTAEGCPSTNTLHLTIRRNSDTAYTKTVCDTYTWTAAEGGDGETYTTSGIYTFDYTAANGCPSSNTLNLTVNQNSGHTDVIVACDSAQWHGTWYYADNNTATYDYADANNCPSVDVLNLTINHATHNAFTEVACNSYTWDNNGNSNTYTASGEYLSVYNNGLCPSVDTLHLTIGNGHAFDRIYVTNCGPYTWTVEDQTVGVYTESVQTSTTVTNPATGCDSTIFLYLTINPQNVTEASICDGGEYVWSVNNTTYTEAGTYDVAENDANGNCISSERLVLTVNPTMVTNLTDQICLGNGYTANGFNIEADSLPAAGVYTFVDHRTTDAGCEHTYNLTLTVGDVLTNTLAEVAACDSYTWNNVVYTESGNYESAPYANNDGCTTIDILPLTINVNAGSYETEVACDAFMWRGEQRTATGDYYFDFTDANGCNGTDTLHLTINNSVINNIAKTACDSYTWTDGNGETYTASGMYTYNYTTVDGCNGTDVLILTINTNTNTEFTETACDSFVWNDTEYTESGDYEFNYTADNGCPSTDILHLTVKYSTTDEETAEACNFYNWHGETYTASGDYTYVSTNNEGCPNTTTLHLTINNPVVVTIDTTVCGMFKWNGITYDASDVITHHFTAANGCDSTEIINLTVNRVQQSVTTATACDSYTWDANGQTYTESGLYMAIIENGSSNGCDSLVTLNLVLNYATSNNETVTACDSYSWHGATFTTSGTQTYVYTADNGCASVDTLNLTINNSTTGNVTAEACNYYIWNGTAYDQTGNYTQTYTAANGCDSVVTLALTINTQVTNTITANACGSYNWNGASYTASGSYTQNFSSVAGCDSVVTLNLTINPAITNNISATACGSYSWNNVNYTVSGIYTHTYSAANGCDSIVTLALTINQPKTSTLAVTACSSYTWNGVTYTTSGNYTNVFTAANGCDSIVTLALTINNPVATTLTESACGSYTWNGATYTTSGAYTQNYIAANGCDSVVTLNLTITPSVSSSFDMTVCGSYTWEGTTYTTTGAYTHIYTSATGCDSIVTLNLTIAPAITTTATATACDTYTWNNNVYTTSGSYTGAFTSVDGCDSIVTLALTINYSSVNDVTETACDSYTWNGQTYTTSGVYSNVYTGVNGCDSTVNITLTVNQSTSATDERTACESYTWIDGITYTASTDTPTFTLTNAAGCDSVLTLELTINHATAAIDEQVACDGYIWIDGVNYTESTNEPTYTLTGSNGCDSVVTLHLTVNQSIEVFDTITVNSTELPYNYRGNEITAAGDYIFYATAVTGCDSTVNLHVNVNQIGIDVVSLDEIKVYPNPTRGRINITAEDVVKVEVLDIVGRLVATFEGTNTCDLSNLGEGAYTLRITLPEGVTIRKIVKK